MNFLYRLFLLGILFLGGNGAFSQQSPIPTCGTPSIDQLPASQQQRLRRMDQRISQSSFTRSGTMTIPVVVHIIHQNGAENIPNSQVFTALDHLNEAFQNVGPYDPTTGAPSDIQFCLAQRDPQGQVTTGILRVQDPLTDMVKETQDTQLKALSYWSSLDYLNIWIVASIHSQSSGPGVVGYATLPLAHGSAIDGIVMEADFFGSSPSQSVVTIHEAGHYLGLYHTFEGGCVNNDCQLDGDRVCDTPPDATTAHSACSASPNTCQTDEDDTSANNPFRPVAFGGLGDQPDMHINYMDYSPLTCQTAFSQGQVDRMSLQLQQNRTSLLSSLGCLTPCPNPITANFVSVPDTIQLGTPIAPVNLSSGATSWNWFWDGNLISSGQNISYTPPTTGLHFLKMVAMNSNPNCLDSLTRSVQVMCPMQASFTQDLTEVQPGDTVTFIQNTPGSLSYQWLVDGLPAGTGDTLSHVFSDFGGNEICLVTNSGTCQDTVCTYVPVGDCGRMRAMIWNFGFNYNGLSFHTDPPTPLSTSLGGYSEGGATICNSDGYLVLATNGIKVQRGLESTTISGMGASVAMPNGDSIQGGFARSSTQSSMFIPKPDEDSVYYLFSLDEINGFVFGPGSKGLSYSTIDLRVPGATVLGGDVVQKNKLLYTWATEKMCAVRHANGCDVWVLTHEFESKDFYAYRVTPQGVDTVPVISSVGTTHIGGFASPNQPKVVNGQGQMKFSADGSKVALVIQDTSIVEILDFDKSTGLVFNPKTIDLLSAGWGRGIYGLEFSPNGRYIYVSKPFGSLKYIVQMDTEAGTETDILNSLVKITPFSDYYSGLQVAPNGKIYCAMWTKSRLSVISSPNSPGVACGFQYNAQNLNSDASLGLPSFMADFASTPTTSIHGKQKLCTPQPAHYFMDKFSCADSVTWTLGSGGTITSEDESGIWIDWTQIGTHTLIGYAKGTCGEARDTMQIEVLGIEPPSFGADKMLCPNGGSVVLAPGSAFVSYLWSNGATTPTLTVSQPDTFWVEVVHANGCVMSDTVIVNEITQSPTVDLGPDTTVCDGQILTIHAGSGFSGYDWSTSANDSSITIWQPGTYWVTVKDACNQTATDTIVVDLDNSLMVSLGSDTTICTGDSILLEAGTGFSSYYWQNGSSAPQQWITGPGTYWVEVLGPTGCVARDSIEITRCKGTFLNTFAQDIRLFPNPAQDHVSLSAGNGFEADGQIVGLDLSGRQVSAHRIQAGETMVDIPMGHLAQGIYLFRIQIGQQQGIIRVLKE
ncbi:M43 family zinc metalloprotease [Pontibacter sp. G13]|uniref:M43 family zinc metalloprotease n=1 Tax=Pontibacter sp. G13 TaxID=3074898 RepID=UPI0028890668|nr:M43 family zinc metalloprotease [Pontibacter sp. G13]WNJ18161.1 M43 family zinc metalloprotease [Pontibacter sp. G13]